MSIQVLRWQASQSSLPWWVAVVAVHAVLLWGALSVWGPPDFKSAQAPVLALLLPEPAPAVVTQTHPNVTAKRQTPEPTRPAVVSAPEPAPVAAASPVVSAPPTASPSAMSVPSAPSAPFAGPPVSVPVVSTPPPAVARTPALLQASHACEKPVYPATSRRLEEEGTVVLRFLVQADGKVVDSQVEKSSGFRRLDEAARQALARCQFKAATVDGKPEQSWTSLRYTWRLE